MAKYFVDNPNNLPEVNHLDGNKSNNNNWNLEWVDRKGNINHALNTGLMKCNRSKKGFKHLTLEEITEIINLYNNGLSYTKIGIKYGKSLQSISKIINKSKSKDYVKLKEIKGSYAPY